MTILVADQMPIFFSNAKLQYLAYDFLVFYCIHADIIR